MKMKKEITLDIEMTKTTVICGDNLTLQMVCGTSGVNGNLHCYGVTKKGNKFHVPKSVIIKRIGELEKRKTKIDRYLEIMRQVITDGS